MLAFSSNSSLFDAHFHVNSGDFSSFSGEYRGIACAVTPKEWQEADSVLLPAHGVLRSFGVHPWTPSDQALCFLERLLQEGRLCAVGEAGLDFFTPNLAASAYEQRRFWHAQLALAGRFSLPLVVHARKSLSHIMQDSFLLRSLGAVVFHGFSGSAEEAAQILRKIPCAYFSFGAVLCRGGKKAASCLASIPAERVLLETDTAGTALLPAVYEAAYDIRSLTTAGERQDFCAQVLLNARTVFG